MKPAFQIRGPSGPFDDPYLYLRFRFSGRALLFDLGDLGDITPRDLLRVTDIFVSHTHMDHFIGFDRVLRLNLHRSLGLSLYGPAGFLDRLEGRLSGYTWNVTQKYPLVVRAHEVDGRSMQKAVFPAGDRFRRIDLERSSWDGILREEKTFKVEAEILDHGTPCLGFRLVETLRVNIRTSELHRMGLEAGPWLADFKNRVLCGELPGGKIQALGKDGPVEREMEDLGGIYRKTRGQVISYIVDAADNAGNEEKIIRLSRNADLLFIEAAFSAEDIDLARPRNHLTADRAAELASRAGVRKVRIVHLSPRYIGREEDLLHQACRAAGGRVKVERGWKRRGR